MMELSKKATEKGLSVVCGTQRRYYQGYQEAIKRVQDGGIGELSQRLYDTVTGIQLGKIADTKGWVVEVK